MKDIILILSVVAIFFYGYFMMKKLDLFLAQNHRKSEEDSLESSLRIAFETPALVDSMSDILDHFLKEYPNCELSLFYGSASEIRKKLEKKEIDFGLILNSSSDTLEEEYLSFSIPVKQRILTSNSVGFSVVPLSKSEKQTKILWRRDERNRMKEIFAEKLHNFS